MTKRELREQRRAHREALEAADAAKSTRRRRLSILGGALAAAVAVIAVAALVSTNSNSNAAPNETLTRSTVVAGVQERNGVLGDPNAPVTITEYVDLQCPICAEASTTILPGLIDDYVKTGKVKLELRTMHFLGPDSVKSARVAAGAQQQNKLWSFVETFYANQGTENSGYATDDFINSLAADAGLKQTDAGAAAERRVRQSEQAAQSLGIDSTPSFLIGRTGGPMKRFEPSDLTPDAFIPRIQEELRR